jgi:hypothetical protein
MGQRLIALLAGDGCGVDDLAAFPLGKHRADRLLHADQHAERVDIGNETPVILGYVEEGLGLGDARVVEDHVQAAMGLDRLIDHGAHAFALADIDRDADGGAAALADFGGGLAGGFFRQVGDGQSGAVGGEPSGDFGTDPAPGAGYDDAFVFNARWHGVPP